MYNIKDIVVALATIPGKSALNVIRVSGPDLAALYHQLTLNKKQPKPNYAQPCFVYNIQKKEKIDYSVITYFKGPKSFTGDDILELSINSGAEDCLSKDSISDNSVLSSIFVVKYARILEL